MLTRRKARRNIKGEEVSPSPDPDPEAKEKDIRKSPSQGEGLAEERRGTVLSHALDPNPDPAIEKMFRDIFELILNNL